MRRLASVVNGAKNARNQLVWVPARPMDSRGYKLPWSLLDEKRSGELASLESPENSTDFGRRMSWLWGARRAFETMDTGHRLRRALQDGIPASAHTQGIVKSELIYVWRKV